MALLSLVTLLALLVYMWITLRVGRARGRYEVPAPATTGHPIFERMYRVQQNTVEQLVVFLPALWIFGTFLSARVGAAVGLFFVVGRILYALGYVAEPAKRSAGFLIGYLSNTVLVLGALAGSAMKLP